ncbi:MAG: ABC transporter ATP-binding protein [Thermostichus sp. DG02_5_bins_236]
MTDTIRLSSLASLTTAQKGSPPPNQKPHPLLRLLSYGRAYHRQMGLATLCSVLNQFFDLAPPFIIGAAIDIVAQRESRLINWFTVGELGDLRTQFLILTGLSFLIWWLESAFEYAYARLWRNLAQNIEHDLRLDAYSHVQELETAYFEERSTGGLMAILNDDINQLERFLDIGANELIHVAATIIIISIAFVLLAPGIAWTAVLPMPFVIWGSLLFQRYLAPRYAEVRGKVSLLSGRLANNLGGMTTIKSFVTEDSEVERLRADSEAYRQSNFRAIALSAAFIPLIRNVILLGFAATLLFGGFQTADGLMSVGVYSMMVFLIQRLLWPLTRLGETMDQYQRAMASTNRVLDLLDTPIQIQSGTTPLVKEKVKGEIVLQDVTFAYHDRQPVIEQLHLRIPAGQTIAIVGATGSGKSTLVKLLLRLYEIRSGVIALDGIDIRQLNLRDLRRVIGWVSQDVFLFHGTVGENIAYGSPGATLEEIVQAAQLAEAHEFIETLPRGYDTIVGERGQKLSGGQRQRLAIARAILKDPPILILDEATSAVDNETEAAIQRSLEKITRNRTTIVIAHRLSTIRDADQIYVMEQGRIAEFGDHDALLAKKGLYAALWRVQTGIRL